MKKTLVFTTLCTLGLTAVAKADTSFVIRGDGGAVLTTLSYAGAENGVTVFRSNTEPALLWIEDFNPNQFDFHGVFAVMDAPACPQGPITDPLGYSLASWGLAKFNFAEGHRGFEMQVSLCDMEAPVSFYGEVVDH